MDEARVAMRSHRHDRAGVDDSFDIETKCQFVEHLVRF